MSEMQCCPSHDGYSCHRLDFRVPNENAPSAYPWMIAWRELRNIHVSVSRGLPSSNAYQKELRKPHRQTRERWTCWLDLSVAHRRMSIVPIPKDRTNQMINNVNQWGSWCMFTTDRWHDVGGHSIAKRWFYKEFSRRSTIWYLASLVSSEFGNTGDWALGH